MYPHYDYHQQPGVLAIMGGRTHTRKTTVMVNLVVNMLKAGRAVGLVGLDENPPQYVAKVASAMSGVNHEYLEEHWDAEQAKEIRTQYLKVAGRLVLSSGTRPSFDHLSSWLDNASVAAARPEVVFIDYLSLLARDKYAGSEVQRLPRLVEDLQVWTAKEQLVTIALHQVNREHEGHVPMTLSALKYGGEEIADIVFGTYRPALDPLGNMDYAEAEYFMGDKFDEEKHSEAVAKVKRTQDVTYLQLLKNRPGTRLCEKGVQVKSRGDSMKMVPASESIGADMKRTEVASA